MVEQWIFKGKMLQRHKVNLRAFEAAAAELRVEGTHRECPVAIYEPSPVSEKFLGLKGPLFCSKLTIFVAEFHPNTASLGSSTSLTQQGHL